MRIHSSNGPSNLSHGGRQTATCSVLYGNSPPLMASMWTMKNMRILRLTRPVLSACTSRKVLHVGRSRSANSCASHIAAASCMPRGGQKTSMQWSSRRAHGSRPGFQTSQISTNGQKYTPSEYTILASIEPRRGSRERYCSVNSTYMYAPFD